MSPCDFSIRPLTEADSLVELTELLQRAYARLADMGLQYLAARQSVEVTREKISRGECFVMLSRDRIVGTILVTPPSVEAPYCTWYDRPDVAMGGQFAVEPALQGLGLGGRLLQQAEDRARSLGASEFTVDTAEPATYLIEFYKSRGYRLIGFEQWNHTNYRSVLLSKRLNVDPA